MLITSQLKALQTNTLALCVVTAGGHLSKSRGTLHCMSDSSVTLSEAIGYPSAVIGLAMSRPAAQMSLSGC